ncbi:MAG: SPOR domain-containing protein [Ectothiorhodospiraceae bacterium]|nr:SPOR domain-containing protein [Ectothiorhodospiraceae bacterium]
MKWLVMVLLCLNLAWFGVMWWSGEVADVRVPVDVPTVQPPAPSLTLLSDVVQISAETPVRPVAKADVGLDSPIGGPGAQAQTQYVCVTVGPLSDPAAALREQERPGVLSAWLRTEMIDQIAGYWVFLPPSRTRDDAVAVTHELAAKGFTDYFVVRKAENRNAISLGLFSSEKRARDRQDLILKMGFPAQITTRTSSREVTWLDVVLADAGDGFSSAVSQRLKNVQVRPIPCPAEFDAAGLRQ